MKEYLLGNKVSTPLATIEGKMDFYFVRCGTAFKNVHLPLALDESSKYVITL